MAGITDAESLNKVIPFGFDTATLGGYSLDAKTIEASEKIIKRGRNEFHFPQDEIVNHIEKEVNLIKKQHPNVKVSANVRSTTPRPIIEVSNIDNLDIVEIIWLSILGMLLTMLLVKFQLKFELMLMVLTL